MNFKRIVYTLVALSLAYVSPAAAQDRANTTTPRSATRAEQQLVDLSKTTWRWMSEKKVDTLATLFHEDAVFVHMVTEVYVQQNGGWKLGSLSFTKLLSQ